jgi:serine/threonine protein kinase
MSKFGQYQLFDRIAIGGMAEIFRGRAAGEEGFEKQVAIKRILPAYARDTRFVSMLVTEARIHSALTHRNIVQIHDLGVSEDGEYFIVLEYVDGHDLGALLARMTERRARGSNPAQLSDAIALYIAIELGEGIHFAHELTGADGLPLNLIHRDISPSNVLLSYAGEVKLSDFGLAKRRTDHSVVGSLKGKLAYMSPEQARRAPIDRRSDLFALGAVFYEMLTGHPLREIEDSVAGWQQVASGLVPPARRMRPDLSPAIEHLVQKALEPDPRDRYPNVRAFVNEARAALEDQPRSRLGEAGELQSLLRALLPPGTLRPPRPPSRVIRLLSEILNTETVQALGSDLTVPGTEAPSAGKTEASAAGLSDVLGGSADEPSTITVVAPLLPGETPAGPPPPPVAPVATLEWPRPKPPPVPSSSSSLPSLSSPSATRPGAPADPGPGGAEALPILGSTGESAAPPAWKGSALGDPAPDEALRSVAGLIEIEGRAGGAPRAPVGSDDRIIAAWPSLLPPGGLPPGGLPGASAELSAGDRGGNDSMAAGHADLPAPAGLRPDRRREGAAEGTPPLGGAAAPISPAPPLQPPFPPAPSAPGPVRAPLDPGAPEPAGPTPFFPPTLASHVDAAHRTEDYAHPHAAPPLAGQPPPSLTPLLPPPTPPLQPIFYAPPPPPPRRRTGEMTSVVARKAGVLAPGRVLLLLFLLAAGVAGVAAVVHFMIVPLEVVLVWGQPARLHVRTNPRGAEVFLDGQRLSARTPTYTEIYRDRRSHTLEVHADGYQTETRQIRYDRRVNLEETLDLQPASAPAIEPVGPPPGAAPTTTGSPAPATTPAAAAPSEPARKSRGKAARAGGKSARKPGKAPRKSKPAPSAGQRSAK